MDRKTRILGAIVPRSMRGLEIRVLNNPTIFKSEGEVKYVDYANADHLRKNQFSETVRPEDICDVDIVWAEKPLRDCVSAPVDYVVAVHVIEHVPDVIGWLLDLHGALRADGILSLVVPDRRFTFDILQPTSTVGQMLDAYFEKRRRPSPGQKFDFTSLWRPVDVQSAWRGDIDVEALPPICSNATAIAFAQAKEIFTTGHYMDCHCWIFTPSSFLDGLGKLAEIELFPYSISSFQTTLPGELEFMVQLSAKLSPKDPSIPESIELAKRTLKAETRPTPRVDELEAEIFKLRAEIGSLRSSTSWKITAPLRSLSRFSRRIDGSKI